MVLGFPCLKIKNKKLGCTAQIIGLILDVSFSLGKRPNIYNALVGKGWDITGQKINVTYEIQQLLWNNQVRVMVINDIDGLMRGMRVIEMGVSLSVPVC